MTDLQKAIDEGCGDKMALSTFISCVKSGGFIPDDGYGDLFYKETGEKIDIDPFDMIGASRKEMKNYVVMWYNR